MKKEKDFLFEFTKEELIQWIRENCFFRNKPKKSELLHIRLLYLSEKEQKDAASLFEYLRSIDGKKRDDIAVLFNNENDYKKKLALYEELKKFDDKFSVFFKREEEQHKLAAKISALHEEYMRVLEEE